jgi:hypothetical protein
MSKRRIAVAVAILSGASLAAAHVPQLEPQATYAKPWRAPASADASFANPYVLPLPVVISQAIFAYLSPEDVDVYAFTVQPGGALVAASALPPACNQTKAHFPVTALLGYGLPPPDREYPFAIPPGMGILFAPNPRPAGGAERAIFSDPNLGLSWFLPLGLTQDCLFNGGCDYSNTIAAYVAVPGTYYLVMWDPDGVPQDYTANIGFLEGGPPPDPAVLEQVMNGAWLHGPCTPPYPGQ